MAISLGIYPIFTYLRLAQLKPGPASGGRLRLQRLFLRGRRVQLKRRRFTGPQRGLFFVTGFTWQGLARPGKAWQGLARPGKAKVCYLNLFNAMVIYGIDGPLTSTYDS